MIKNNKFKILVNILHKIHNVCSNIKKINFKE